MLELLIGTFMAVGIQFTQLDDRRVAISSKDAEILRTSTEFQMIIDEGVAADEIVVTDSIDPTSDSSQHE
jgi:hypothetical protein